MTQPYDGGSTTRFLGMSTWQIVGLGMELVGIAWSLVALRDDFRVSSPKGQRWPADPLR